ISVFLRRSARCFSEGAGERSLIRGSSLVRKKRVHDGGSLCRLPGCYRSSDSPFIAAGVILVIEIEMVVRTREPCRVACRVSSRNPVGRHLHEADTRSRHSSADSYKQSCETERPETCERSLQKKLMV